MAPDEDAIRPREDVEDITRDYGFAYGYAFVIERHPLVILLLILLINIFCGAITYLQYGIPSFEEPRLGFETRNTELSARDLSFQKFLWADADTLSPMPRTSSASPPPTNRTRKKGGVQDVQPLCPLPGQNQLKIIFTDSKHHSANLFDAEHLKSICRHEGKLVRSHHSFLENCIRTGNENNAREHACCPSWSLGYVVALLNNKSSCVEINQTDVDTVYEMLRNCSHSYESDKDVDGDIMCAEGSLVHTVFHFLVPKSFAEEIERGIAALTFSVSFSPLDVQCSSCKKVSLKIYDDNFQNLRSLDDGVTTLVAFDFKLTITIFDRLIISDFLFVALGVLTAAIIIWTYTGSFFIMLGSLSNMLFSTTLAYFMYHIVFQIHFFPFSNLASLILVIGIGADDTFVFVDVWKAAKNHLKQTESREKRVLALQDATQHATLTILVTTLTTSGALYTTISSNIIVVKCFAVFAGTILVSNFIYTITWLPTIIILHDKYFTSNRETKRSCSFLRIFPSSSRKSCQAVRHYSRSVFRTAFLKLIYSLRYVWIIVSLLLGASGIIFTFVYPGLKLHEGATLPFFKESHPFERYNQIYKNDLAFTQSDDDTFPIAFLWGILPSRNQNRWDPFDFGHLELDPDFYFGDNATQNWLLNFCEDVKQQQFFGNKTSFCFMDSFKEWMERPCSALVQYPCCDQDAFPFSEELFGVCARQYAAFFCQSSACIGFEPGLRFDKNNSIKALYLSFDSSVPFSLYFQPVDTFWKDLLKWSTEKMSKAPEGLKTGWCYSKHREQLSLYGVNKGIPRGTLLTISAALVLTTIVLLVTTRNILITVFAVVTISITNISTIGCLVWLGWELNLFESIMFTLGLGLSVDFSIHFGVAYLIAPCEDRKGRTMIVIETLGASITAAAISTFTAGAIMIPAVVITYNQIGVFLTVVMACSWYYSMFLFLPLCFVLGPKGDQGLLKGMCNRFGKGGAGTTSMNPNDNPSYVA